MSPILLNFVKASATISIAGAAVFALGFLPDFKMVPLRRWKLPADLLFYFPSLVGIGISLLFPKSQVSNRIRIICITFSAICAMTLLPLYSQLSEVPPTPQNEKIWSVGCFLSFVFGYAFAGYCLAQLGKIIIGKSKPTKPATVKKNDKIH